MPVSSDELRRAIRRATRSLWQAQRPDGSWDERSDVGPSSTANVLVALDHVGLLPASELRDATRWLRSRQDPADGSFRPYPHAPKGDLSVTAQCWAALSLSNQPDDVAAAKAAEAFVTSEGGLDALITRMSTGDIGAVYVALAGLMAPSRLPSPGIGWCLFDTLVDMMGTRFHFGVTIGALELGLIAKDLQGDFGRDGSRRSWLEKKACRRAVELITSFQNADGSWNSNTVQTALAIPALVAAGLGVHDERVQRAVRWIRSRVVVDRRGVWFDVFASDVWTTAFTMRALLLAGEDPTDPRFRKATVWLLDAQLEVPQPRVNNRRAAAIRTGGWPFQTGNETMADCDDAGVVLSALGMIAEHLDLDLRRRLDQSVSEARLWLRGMQNPDGGWSAFVWNLPGERAQGYTLFSKTPNLPPDNLLKAAKAFLSPPPELGDPSTEDLTARVLHGLGSFGATTMDSDVAAAISFLKRHQTDAGGWWGRWVCNYVASTSYVLGALAALREDPNEAYVRAAIDFVLSRQNDDGGFGESTETYRDPNTEKRAASTPPLTALAVQGLVEIGEGERPEVHRAVELLITKQRPDGTWPNEDYVATNLPPDGFYTYAGAARHMPLEALARFARRHEQEPIVPAEEHGRWSSERLEQLRGMTDPVADAVADEIYADGNIAQINLCLQRIFENDDPIPPGLPAPARAFFDATDGLPEWADEAKIAKAQHLFQDHGVYVTFGFFCSSLPQAYCAANGAQVLGTTRSLLDSERIEQRIFETAQFLFDVLDAGGLDQGGRGIRSAQRVRLMHAAIRRLIKHGSGAAWDSARLGQPINQEDLVGTLLTFSLITYQATQRFGVSWSRDDAEAWIHHWSVVGHIMGIQGDVLPRDLDDAHDLMEAIRQHQWRHSDVGEALAHTLIEMMQSFFTKIDLLDGLTPTLIRHLAGDRCADLLRLDEGDWTRLLIGVATDVTDLVDDDGRDTWLEHRLGLLTGRLMRWITTVERRHKNASFRIPASLEATVVPGT